MWCCGHADQTPAEQLFPGHSVDGLRTQAEGRVGNRAVGPTEISVGLKPRRRRRASEEEDAGGRGGRGGRGQEDEEDEEEDDAGIPAAQASAERWIQNSCFPRTCMVPICLVQLHMLPPERWCGTPPPPRPELHLPAWHVEATESIERGQCAGTTTAVVHRGSTALCSGRGERRQRAAQRMMAARRRGGEGTCHVHMYSIAWQAACVFCSEQSLQGGRGGAVGAGCLKLAWCDGIAIGDGVGPEVWATAGTSRRPCPCPAGAHSPR